MTSDPTGAEPLEFARRIALRLLEARSRSEAELRSKLVSRNVPEHTVEELIRRFREVGLVDDEAFAAALVQTRVHVDRHGTSRIRAELLRRGISDEVASSALAKIQAQEELSAARTVALRRVRGLRDLEPHVARRRLYGALGRRGFTTSVISKVVHETLGEAEVDQDGGSW